MLQIEIVMNIMLYNTHYNRMMLYVYSIRVLNK